jgi:hypothetical protein
VRCSSLVDWPVYSRLAHTMQGSTLSRNKPMRHAARRNRAPPLCGGFQGRPPVFPPNNPESNGKCAECYLASRIASRAARSMVLTCLRLARKPADFIP